MSPAAARILTLVAAVVLAFDGAALALVGVWSDRLVLGLVGVVFFLSSALVLWYWRWYRRRLADIASARRALGEEARQLRDLLRQK